MLQQKVNKHTGSTDRAFHSFTLQIPDHDTNMTISCVSINKLTDNSHTFTLIRVLSSTEPSGSRAPSADEKAWPKRNVFKTATWKNKKQIKIFLYNYYYYYNGIFVYPNVPPAAIL